MNPISKTAILTLLFAASAALLQAEDLREPPFNQPNQKAHTDKDLDDGTFVAVFEDERTSVVEVRIGDHPSGHNRAEKEVLLTSGNPNWCAPQTPASASLSAVDISPGIYDWSLEYRDGNTLDFTFDGRTVSVVLTQPITEILIRTQAVKDGTEVEVSPRNFHDTYFKECRDWEHTNGVPFGNDEVAESAGEGPDWLRISLEHITHGFEFEGQAFFEYDEGDPPLRSQLAFQIKLNCNTPAIPNPGTFMSGFGNYEGCFQVVAGGLEATEICSLERPFADAIFVPYGKFRNNRLGTEHVFQLNVPDEYWVENKLIRLVESGRGTSETGSKGRYVRATFQLESRYECVRITQWHEMHDTVNPWNPDHRSEMPYPMPPSSTSVNLYSDVLNDALYPAERYLPIVYYEFVPNCIGTEIESMRLPTRCDWPVQREKGKRNVNASAFSRDPDVVEDFDWDILKFGVTFFRGTRRLDREGMVFGFSNNGIPPSLKDRSYDNYHFSILEDAIDAPGGFGADTMIPPGCPECVHIHWRWGEFLNWPDGLPLVPEAERGCQDRSAYHHAPRQNLFAHALFSIFEERRDELKAITDGDTLYSPVFGHKFRRPQAFGYRSFSFRERTNAFFTHGISFNGNYSKRNERLRYPDFNPDAPRANN